MGQLHLLQDIRNEITKHYTRTFRITNMLAIKHMCCVFNRRGMIRTNQPKLPISEDKTLNPKTVKQMIQGFIIIPTFDAEIQRRKVVPASIPFELFAVLQLNKA